MKIQYKFAGSMVFIGTICLVFIIIISTIIINQVVIREELQNIENLSLEIAQHLNTHLKGSTENTLSFASAPILKAALSESNTEYLSLSEEARNKKIDILNKRWMGTEDTENPFIQQYLTNPAAEFLKLQQTILPGLYGEIFLTNRYGAMIASTGKLTTLAHASKYWWKASFFEGKGRVFLDDRGFDESVNGYVLGIVVPIMERNEIIGILKSNINIEGPLTDIIIDFSQYHPEKLQIARTKGLVIKEKGEFPLSTNLPEGLIPDIGTMKAGSTIFNEDLKPKLAAYTPIPLTVGSDQYGFGGNYESIDHIQGNEGEGWHIVISLDEETVLEGANRMSNLLLLAGVVLILLASVVALLLGKWFANPLIKLSSVTQQIGEGNLNIRTDMRNKDEIGALARSINTMTDNLSQTLISRDNLAKEVNLRKEAEEKVKIQLKEKEVILKETHHRIKNNFTSIGSILSLQANVLTNPEAITALQEAISRINSMAILYENLLIKDEYHFVSIKEYLDNLIDRIINLFPYNLKVEKQLADYQMEPKLLIPIGIIVNELLTNIMKYAFIDRDSGLIEITLEENNGCFTLIIMDDGIGLPDGFKLEEQKGFGLMLIEMLIQQLDGSFSIENHIGTRSIIKFCI